MHILREKKCNQDERRVLNVVEWGAVGMSYSRPGKETVGELAPFPPLISARYADGPIKNREKACPA